MATETEIETVVGHVTVRVPVTAQQMDDICTGALEGGINYWATRAEIAGARTVGATYASEVVSRGGALLLHREDGRPVRLTREKLLRGIQLAIESGHWSQSQVLGDDMDAESNDVVIQYAVFGELVYC